MSIPLLASLQYASLRVMATEKPQAKGGRARMQKLTVKQQRALGQKGGKALWAKIRAAGAYTEKAAS